MAEASPRGAVILTASREWKDPQVAPEQRTTDSLRQEIQELLDEKSPKLSVLLSEQRPEDIAEVLGDFRDRDKLLIFQASPRAQQALILDETDDYSRESLATYVADEDLVHLVQEMPPDEATDFIEAQTPELQAKLLASIPAEKSRDIRKLLQYLPESAGGIMTSSFLRVAPTDRVSEVLEKLQSTIDTEVISYVYAADEDDRLCGVFSIRELLTAGPDQLVQDIMATRVISALVSADQEEVANLARKYNLNSIPIVDESDRLLGVATIDDLIDIVGREADEDIFKFAGAESEAVARASFLRRTFARIPWLILPGVSGFVVAGVIEGESQQSLVRLISFLPLVMGISGAAGTQSSTLLVRGLATGELEGSRVRRVWTQELLIGFTVAIALAILSSLTLAGFMAIELYPPNPMLPLAVSSGLVTGVMIATISGVSLPLLFKKAQIDPALGAGPLVTSLIDVLAATCFFGIGNLLLAA